jgi:hypothetical protein
LDRRKHYYYCKPAILFVGFKVLSTLVFSLIKYIQGFLFALLCKLFSSVLVLLVVQILADNIGKMVEVAFVKAEDNSRRSVYLPVEEIPEGDFYRYLYLST